jgi:hypothetical protein
MELSPEHLALISLCGTDRSIVKRLSGFEKHHSIPLRVDDYHNQWIAKIAEKELESDINDTARHLRKTLNYKRKDIVAGLDGNTGYVNTPTFAYRLTIALDPESPAHVCWKREISEITTTEIIMDGELSLGFGDQYQETRYQANRVVSIENLIDTFEEKDIEIDYPHDFSSCTLPLPAIDGQVVVHPSGFTIEYGFPQAPHSLMHDLHNILPLGPDEFISALLEA